MTLFAKKLVAGFAALLLALPLAAGPAHAAYTQAELDQMLAPIALYPDPLLSQVLMASTYPQEVAEAARWSRAHPGVNGDDAVRMVEDQDWDPSVKSLVAFPQVLTRMDENPDWTRRLGDAFIVQEPVVMETIQGLRRRAEDAGQLASDDRLRVVRQAQSIVIEPASPQYVYVPYYDPWIAYGPWWWPAYPPFAWAPWPGYVRAYRPGLSVGFWWGAPVGISAGFFFGGVDWPRRHVSVVRVDNYYVRRAGVNRQAVVTPGRWRHDYWRSGTEQRTAVARPQFTAPAPLREQRREERRREASRIETQRLESPRNAVRPDTRWDEQRRGIQQPPLERRQDAGRLERRHESRRDEPRQAFASPQRAERAPAVRIEQSPAPREERRSAPRAERAPAARIEQAPAPSAQRGPAPRAEHAPAARTERHERHERRQEAHATRDEHRGGRDRQAVNR